MTRLFLIISSLCSLSLATTVIYYYQAPAGGGTSNRSVSFPGGTGENGDFIVVTTDFDSANILDFSTHKGSFYVRAKANTWGGDYRTVLGASDTGWGRGVAFSHVGTNLRFWVGGWNTNFDDVAIPSTGTWFNAVGRIEKDGNGVKLCVNGTDGSGDTLTSVISDTLTIPFRIGSTNGSGFVSEFDGVIDEVAIWNTYMDNTSKATLCASGYKGDPSSTYASPTIHYVIDSSDSATTTDGIADTGSLNLDGDGAATLSLSTDVAP